MALQSDDRKIIWWVPEIGVPQNHPAIGVPTMFGKHSLSNWLVVWNILIQKKGIIIPTDELILFRGVGIPPAVFL